MYCNFSLCVPILITSVYIKDSADDAYSTKVLCNCSLITRSAGSYSKVWGQKYCTSHICIAKN